MNCSLCKTPLLNKPDEEYYSCSCCKAWVKEKGLYLTPEEERLHYLSHNNDINDPRYKKFSSPISDYILKNFGKDQEGLDFGSGTGPVISEVLKEANYPVKQFDPFFANFTEVLHLQYDYVFACEVVEHFQNPRDEFYKLYNLLKPNGKILIMTHIFEAPLEFKTWYYRKDPTHVFIYRRETFEYIAAEFKFNKCEIEGRLVVLSK